MEQIPKKAGRPKKKHAGGRPTKLTPAILQKLEEAFGMGCPDNEACFHAGIGETTLYNYCKSNPKFRNRKESLKLNPYFKARKTIVESVSTNPTMALEFMKRKLKAEWSDRQEIGGVDGKDLIPNVIYLPNRNAAERMASDA